MHSSLQGDSDWWMNWPIGIKQTGLFVEKFCQRLNQQSHSSRKITRINFWPNRSGPWKGQPPINLAKGLAKPTEL
jgi:hypothetical protein